MLVLYRNCSRTLLGNAACHDGLAAVSERIYLTYTPGEQLCLCVQQRQQASQEEMNSKMEALKTELGYWESYLGSNTYIAGSEFTLAGEPCLQILSSMSCGICKGMVSTDCSPYYASATFYEPNLVFNCDQSAAQSKAELLATYSFPSCVYGQHLLKPPSKELIPRAPQNSVSCRRRCWA